MPRGNEQQTKVIYHGKEDSFFVFVDSEEDYAKWQKDSSVPLAQVVNGWKIFVNHKQGNQGIMDGASDAMLENEFGTKALEECIKQILKQGSTQTKTNPERQGDRNVADGPMGVTH